MQIRSLPIENHILKLLSHNKKMSVKEIYQGLVNQFKEVISLPQLYKIIKKMTNDYVLVKKYGVVMLNAWWINKVMQDISELQQIITPTYGIDLMMHGTTQEYKASSLHERENIQADLMTKIIEEQQPKDLFFYDTHLYSCSLFEDTGIKEYDSYIPKDGKIFHVVGHDTFLDIHASTLIKNASTHLLFDTNSSFTKDWYSLRILGNYVLETYIPDEILPLYERLFSTTTSVATFDQTLCRIPFDMHLTSILKITHDKDLSAKLRKQVMESFPVGLRNSL